MPLRLEIKRKLAQRSERVKSVDLHPTEPWVVLISLQYLNLTRPDITFAVNKLSQFLQNPLETHWQDCKHLLRYLKGTAQLALTFAPSSSSSFVAYSDADWGGAVDDRKSTTGLCVFHGQNIIVWSSKKQDTVSRSSAEAEYRAIATAATELIWLKTLCTELGIAYTVPLKLWCDNSSAITLASNAAFHARTKHIEIDVHFVRDFVQKKIIEVGFVPSNEQIADVFTKPLAAARFQRLRHRLRLGG